MRYTIILHKLLIAAQNLKLEQAHIKYPEAVRNQIVMWKYALEDEYSPKEIKHVQDILTKYFGFI